MARVPFDIQDGKVKSWNTQMTEESSHEDCVKVAVEIVRLSRCIEPSQSDGHLLRSLIANINAWNRL